MTLSKAWYDGDTSLVSRIRSAVDREVDVMDREVDVKWYSENDPYKYQNS